MIQRPSFADHAVGLNRVLEGRGSGSMRRLLPYLVGNLATFCALVGAVSLDDALADLRCWVQDFELISGISFEQRVSDKRALLRSARVRAAA